MIVVGTYTQTFINSTGCDSIHTINFTLINNGVDSVFQTINICTGDSYIIGNSTYTNSGTYYDIFTNSSGCDSIVQTNLNVIDLPVISVDSISHVGCNAEYMDLYTYLCPLELIHIFGVMDQPLKI